MTNEVKFTPNKERDHYDGKRYSRASGIAVVGEPPSTPNVERREVQLWQLNSRGETSRCYLTVPVENVDALIEALQPFATKNRQP